MREIDLLNPLPQKLLNPFRIRLPPFSSNMQALLYQLFIDFMLYFMFLPYSPINTYSVVELRTDAGV